MKVVRHLYGGSAPNPPIELFYNGDLAVDSVTKRYKGSLVKLMDVTDIDNGHFATFCGLTTVLENIVGILEEDQPLTGNYLPNDATYGMTKRKITPILPGSVVRAEYSQIDAAGTANTDTSATGTAASADFTVTIGTADRMIGGWVYFINGSNANRLHYISDNTTLKAVFSTVLAAAVVNTDDFLVICPPFEWNMLIDATYTGIKSEISDSARTASVQGLMHYIEADGIPFQPLDRDKHDGLSVSGARFYHDFVLPGTSTIPNIFGAGFRRS